MCMCLCASSVCLTNLAHQSHHRVYGRQPCCLALLSLFAGIHMHTCWSVGTCNIYVCLPVCPQRQQLIIQWIIYIYIIQILCVCVCVCLSSIGGQTAGPIMTKFGTYMRIDLGMVPTKKKWSHVWSGRVGSLGPFFEAGT